MSLKLQQLAVRGKVPRDVRESCLTGPGCAGTREHIRGGKKEKGNRIKGKSSLNTKGGLGKSSIPSRQCPEDGTGLPRAKQPSGDGDTGRLRERTRSPRWCRGVAFQQPAQHRCVRQMRFPGRLCQSDGFCCVTWLAVLMPVTFAFMTTVVFIGSAARPQLRSGPHEAVGRHVAGAVVAPAPKENSTSMLVCQLHSFS